MSTSTLKSVIISPVGILIFALSLLLSIISTNPIESTVGVLLLFLIVFFFWKKNQPFIFCYCLMYQWLQIFVSVVEANYFGQDLNECFLYTGRQAIWLAFIGLFVMSVSIYYFFNINARTLYKKQIKSENFNKIFIVYLIFSLINITTLGLFYLSPSLYNLGFFVSNIKLVIFFWLSFNYFSGSEKNKFFWLVCGFEFIIGFFSFFSSFKIVFIVIIITSISTLEKLSFRKILLLIVLAVSCIYTLFIWQMVKGEYRQFLNQGKATQSVNVNISEAFTKLSDLYDNLKVNDIEKNLRPIFRRLGYIDYFSKVVDRVPQYMPYENGSILVKNLTFVLIPRFLNPNKGTKDDSKLTSKYTGTFFSGAAEGTSFGLGFYTEGYIDFGPIGMMLYLCGIALLAYLIYHKIMTLKFHYLLKYSIISVILLPFAVFESSFIFLFGQLLWGTIVNIYLFRSIYRKINSYVES